MGKEEVFFFFSSLLLFRYVKISGICEIWGMDGNWGIER